MKRKHCIWTHSTDGPFEEIQLPDLGFLGGFGRPAVAQVLGEHREQTLAYFERVKRQGTAFVAALLVLSILPLAALPFMSAYGVQVVIVTGSACVIAIGAVLWACPFCTPQTIDMFGIRRSIAIARSCAVTVALVGVAICFIPTG